MNTLVDLRNASRRYAMGDGEVVALEDLTLTIDRGELIVLLGPSGSGKSTLLNLMGGIDAPTSGEVWYDGHPLTGEGLLELHRRNRVGFVFQFYNLLPNLTALENVELATMLIPGSLSPEEALREVGLAARIHHFPGQLSGGEQQRVSIARALAKKPSLLLCDEPTGALDLATGRQVLELLLDINRRLGTTVIIVTHNSALSRVAPRVIGLRGGRIASDTRQEPLASLDQLVW